MEVCHHAWVRGVGVVIVGAGIAPGNTGHAAMNKGGNSRTPLDKPHQSDSKPPPTTQWSPWGEILSYPLGGFGSGFVWLTGKHLGNG